jgi:hypothetical protein
MLDTANSVDEHMSNFGRRLRVALDEFGALQPQFCADVVIGAERTFRAMLVWLVPFCTGKVG